VATTGVWVGAADVVASVGGAAVCVGVWSRVARAELALFDVDWWRSRWRMSGEIFGRFPSLTVRWS
jgi:hypothetical protein